MHTITSTPAEVATGWLRDRIHDAAVVTGGPVYDMACAIWNGDVTAHPAVVVHCTKAFHVQMAVAAATRFGLPLSVRGGGHDWVGRALRDGGIVIDLTEFTSVHVDTERQLAEVSGGALAGHVVAAASEHGFAAVVGTTGKVGITGLTLAGGYGPLNGRFGLALDNVISADVVLADSRLVHTDAEHEPDLFWAIRGGGGNFGVITSMAVRVHPIPELVAGMIMFPFAQTRQVFAGLGRFLLACPDELTVQAGVLTGPDDTKVVFLAPCWSGDPGHAAGYVDALQSLGTPVLAQVAPMPQTAMLGLFDPAIRDGRHYAIGTRNVEGYSDEFIDAIIAAGEAITSPYSGIVFHHAHGATARIGLEDTAFGLRREHLLVEIVAGWEPVDATGTADDGTTHRQWVADFSKSLVPLALPGGYPNLLAPADRDQVDDAYGPNAERLLRLKDHYDPDHVFEATALPANR
jgi:FAD/FMN-containing dehydrogenase